MAHQSLLVLLLLFSCGVCHLVHANTSKAALNVLHDDPKDNEIESDLSEEEPLLPLLHLDEKPIKLNPLKEKLAAELENSKKSKLASTLKPVSDEVLNDLIEVSKHSPVLADDPRFNKMLPDKLKVENSTSHSNKSDDYFYYDYNYDDSDDYENYDETTTVKKPIGFTSELSTTKREGSKSIEMKPIKEQSKQAPKLSFAHDIIESYNNNETNKINEKHLKELDEYKDNENDDTDDDDNYVADEDDIADEDVIYSQNTPCPRYCVCARNFNNFLVATCSRFDPGTQKFGSDVTDLIVSDVGPKYPILLGPEFFLQMGLKHVSSIKISNCTVEYVHPDAFHGLDDLYSVNLTNVGLAIFNPDTFAQNKKLRLLTICGNELSVMSSLHYILKSSSIEEIYLAHNNLIELNPSAFSKLTNVVYINLSNNNLQQIPENVFDTVDTLEELDLSYNSLKTLPAKIFNHTSLAILHLKSNAITHDLHFGTSGLQQLDLSMNSIQTVHHRMFDKMPDLTNLNLRQNSITKVAPDSFLTLKKLRHIDLSFNDLDQVSSLLFFKNSELDVIRLNDNARLTRLPTDGFQCNNGYFNVYYLDISNCAIGALGHKSFSTMPHLASLKMAWNNINNLERDTFAALTKLNDLDLSNNLITHLDDEMFNNNNDITKLNLSGNTIGKLSTQLFMPLNKLRELDVSDCELTALITDNNIEAHATIYKFFETLRSFNASANRIDDISSLQVKYFKNLNTLDISRNPLKCNKHFQDFISYVSLNKKISPNSPAVLSALVNEASVEMEALDAHHDWAKLAKEVCKHESYKAKVIDIVTEHKEEEELEERLEDADKAVKNDDLYLLSLMEKHKYEEARRILEGKEKKKTARKDKQAEFEEIKDDNVESEYDDEDEDEGEGQDIIYDEGEYDTTKKKPKGKKYGNTKISDHGVKVEQIDLREETKDKFLLNKFLLNNDDKSVDDNKNTVADDEEDDDDDDDDDDEEEIIIERGRIYYSGYKFLVPIIVIVMGILALLLILAKIISMVMRKRGERYRMALLAASKNSIVYQKLTEEINAPIKESKQPKVHRYTPINPV